MPLLRRLFRLATILLGLAGAAAAAQTRIENTASLTYRSGGATVVVRSNTDVIETERVRRPSAFSFRLLPIGYRLSGTACTTEPELALTPAPIDATTLAAAPPLKQLDVTTAFIVQLDAPASNRDPSARETLSTSIDADGRRLALPLLETGPDTGVFAGGIPASGDDPALVACDLGQLDGQTLRITFDGDDFSLGATYAQLLDPAGYVFDSHSGTPIDGATVTLLDAQGRPATVYGDDGVSAYPATVVSGAAVTDASGRRYPTIQGRYRFPLVAPGTYLLRVVPPADYTAPSTVARATLASLKDPRGRPFVLTDASFGQPVAISGTAPFVTDIPLDRATGTALLLTKTASTREASPGDVVQYRLTLANRGTVAAGDLHLFDTLPVGLRYERGSTHGAAEPTLSGNGRELDFVIPALAVGRIAEIRYAVSVAPGAPAGEALNRVRVRGGANSSNEAAAAVRLRPLLFTDALTLIGRVTEGDCRDPTAHRRGIPGIRILLEDGTFTVTDRDGLYHVEGVRAGRHVVQLDIANVPATYEPVACDRDTRQAGSAISRFVEGEGGTLKRVDFQLRPTGKTAAARDASPIAAADDATAAGSRDWLPGLKPGIDWVFPAADHNPRAPSLRVVVKHVPGQSVALTVNGVATDPLAFDGSDAAAGVAITRWTGLPLQPGDNRLVARVLAVDGRVVSTLERTVHYAGAPVRAVFDPEHSRLIADGLTRPLVAVRITDAAGRPVRAGTLVPFRVDAPYLAAIDAELDQARQLAGRERAAATARVVGDDGLALIALQPTIQAGAVRIAISLAEERQVRVSEVRAWLAGAQRGWTVVGFGVGTLGYDLLRRHAQPAARGDRVTTDGQLALYAKGRIKGSWLLTIAYDSNHRYDPDRGLLGVIDPDRYYTVYGDGSAQGYDAATRRKLYLRLERREAYALFGDFETGFTDTQLARYSRTLNGVKAAYEGKHLRAAGFAASPDTRYARDEIQGNGLSGPYRLSQRHLVPNSDKLRLEVRDRFRSERIVSSRSLTRHIDYDIDADAGTMRLREPVLGRDAALNPIFIVAEYEVENGSGGKLATAARVVARAGRVELGATVIRDQGVGAAAALAGADLRVRAGRATELRGELAAGGRAGLRDGVAYLAEAEHHAAGIDLLAYARQQDADFGVGQQNLVEAGTRKLGIDTRLQIAPRLSLTATAWHQAQLAGPGTRIAADARLEFRRDTGTIFVGGQLAHDTGLDGRERDSRLVTLGAAQALWGGKVTLAGQTQVAPGGRRDSVDFPARQQLTATVAVAPGIRLLGGYEVADGARFTTHTAQLGFDVAPWTGAKLATTLNQQAVGENGARSFAQYGLSQSLPLGRRWTVDATLDASTTLRGRLPEGGAVTPFQPIASGGFLGQDQHDGDYVAATLGATYRAPRWSWNGRLEYRDSDASRRWGLTSNLLRTLGEGSTLAAGLRLYTLRAAAGAVSTSASADVALALRPLDSRWSLLERLQVRHAAADAGIGGSDVLDAGLASDGQVTTRTVNNLALNYRSGAEGAGHGIEATLYYGAKYIVGRIDGDRYDGFIDATGFELRRDLGARLDIGVQGSVQHAWERGLWAWSGGPSLGVSPGNNLWMTVGYNLAGYRDRDAEGDRYTRAGPYLTLRAKFDQLSIGRAAHALIGDRR